MNKRNKYRVFSRAYNEYLNEESLKLLSIRSDGQLIVTASGFEVQGTIEFSIGLEDSEDILIYDGDIIARYWNTGGIKNMLTVQWLKKNGGWNVGEELLRAKIIAPANKNIYAKGFKIIGDIHDGNDIRRTKELQTA